MHPYCDPWKLCQFCARHGQGKLHSILSKRLDSAFPNAMKSGSLRGLTNLLRIIPWSKVRIPFETKTYRMLTNSKFWNSLQVACLILKSNPFSEHLTHLFHSVQAFGKNLFFQIIFASHGCLLRIILLPLQTLRQIIKKCYNKIKRTERKIWNLIFQNMFGCKCVILLHVVFTFLFSIY